MGARKIIAVMPAYNAAATLEKTYRDIPPGSVDEVIVVDDASRDETVLIARSLGLTVIEHPENRGYGANQKTCYGEALRRGADIVVMIHPDYQYDSRLTPLLTGFIEAGVCDVVLGSRIRTRQEALDCGMPVYKYFANRLLTLVENLCLGQNLGEFHSGFRAYSRQVLDTIPYHANSDDFVFDSQFLIQAVHFGFRIGDVPVPVRYMAEASSINWHRSLTYGVQTLTTLGLYLLVRASVCRSPLFERGSNGPRNRGIDILDVLRDAGPGPSQAEGDLLHARSDVGGGYYDWACFSAQQAAEKAVKAVFQRIGAEAWGHSVADLLQELGSRHEVSERLREAALELDKAYIPARYPNAHPSGAPRTRYTKVEALRLIGYAGEILKFCSGLLPKI